MNFTKICIVLGFMVLIFTFGCKDDSATAPLQANSSITGSVLFLDGTVGAGAPVELIRISNNSREIVNADNNGVYKFTSLTAGEYRLRFKSYSYNIITFEKDLSIAENTNYVEDLYILYNMLDELKTVVKNREVFLITFQPNGAMIGDNHIYVDYFVGNYFGDYSNSLTLGSDVYKIPDLLDWFSNDSLFTPEYIRKNFEYMTSSEDFYSNGMHEIRFYGEDIIKIISNPPNGFAFVKNTDDDRELKIPCVDFNNNDFGLHIKYK